MPDQPGTVAAPIRPATNEMRGVWRWVRQWLAAEDRGHARLLIVEVAALTLAQVAAQTTLSASRSASPRARSASAAASSKISPIATQPALGPGPVRAALHAKHGAGAALEHLPVMSHLAHHLESPGGWQAPTGADILGETNKAADFGVLRRHASVGSR